MWPVFMAACFIAAHLILERQEHVFSVRNRERMLEKE